MQQTMHGIARDFLGQREAPMPGLAPGRFRADDDLAVKERNDVGRRGVAHESPVDSGNTGVGNQNERNF